MPRLSKTALVPINIDTRVQPTGVWSLRCVPSTIHRMSAILPWQPNESCNLVMRHLVDGDCVALPTESTYELVASALQPDAVGRVRQLGQPAFVITENSELADWLPLLRGAGAR